jgi:outer membrane protein
VGLNSNYSTLGQRLDSVGLIYREQVFVIGGQPVVAGFEQPQAFTSSNPYFRQLTNNFGQQAGISIQIPVFTQGRNRLNVERANLLVQQRQAEIDRTRQQLKTDIQSAIVNARAARESLNAAQKTFEALEASYQNSERRFQAGSTNTFELVTTRNNLDVAETNLIIARYEYLFRVKIVEFYQGKALRL